MFYEKSLLCFHVKYTSIASSSSERAAWFRALRVYLQVKEWKMLTESSLDSQVGRETGR